MKTMQPIKPSTFLGRIGIARADITPPPGMYSRAWGAASHDIAEGVHMPLTATAMVIISDSGSTQAIVSVDLCVVGDSQDWHDYRLAIASGAGIEGQIENVLLSLEHSHAAPMLDRTRSNLPGGDLIIPYINQVRDTLEQVTRDALTNVVEAQLVIDIGSCNLAKNRDLELDDSHFACGFNPYETADDTLLVGRITECGTDKIIGTVVNYACHPTTLAWENKLISPDYVGTMRTIVEEATGNALCLFLQGASGELSAKDGHQGDVAVAERQGRQLGYAVLSTLEGMLPAGKQLNFGGIIESGAKLAYWRLASLEESPQMREMVTSIGYLDMPLKPDWLTLAEFEALHAKTEDRALKERYFRRTITRRRIGDGTHCTLEYCFWRLGDIIITTTPTEMYSDYQMSLREAFPDNPILVCNLVNGSYGYVLPEKMYQGDLYQADMTPFADSSFATSIEFSKTQLEQLIK